MTPVPVHPRTWGDKGQRSRVVNCVEDKGAFRATGTKEMEKMNLFFTWEVIFPAEHICGNVQRQLKTQV